MKRHTNKAIRAIVLELLLTDPICRANDIRLQRKVMQRLYGTTDLRVLEGLETNELETVRRERQYLQAKNEKLRPGKKVEEGRMDLEDEYHDAYRLDA